MSGIIAKNASRSSGIIGPVAGSGGGTTNNSVDTMTGDGSDTTLALSVSPGSENNVQITFDGVTQHHSTFSLSGSTITFSTAPPTGVLVEAVSGTASTTGTPDDGTVSTVKIANNAVDETKLKDAFVGDFTDVTVTAADTFLYGDTTDSGNTKKDTVQGILDLAGGGGAWTLINTAVATDDATVTVSGLTGYDAYAIVGSDIVPVTDGASFWLRLGDSSGIDSAGSDYNYHSMSVTSAASTYGAVVSAGAAQIITAVGGIGNASGEGLAFTLYLGQPVDGTMWPTLHGTVASLNGSGVLIGGTLTASRRAVIVLTQVQMLFSSGNVSTGRITVYEISHT